VKTLEWGIKNIPDIVDIASFNMWWGEIPGLNWASKDEYEKIFNELHLRCLSPEKNKVRGELASAVQRYIGNKTEPPGVDQINLIESRVADFIEKPPSTDRDIYIERNFAGELAGCLQSTAHTFIKTISMSGARNCFVKIPIEVDVFVCNSPGKYHDAGAMRNFYTDKNFDLLETVMIIKSFWRVALWRDDALHP
jgi:hypothetical protein